MPTQLQYDYLTKLLGIDLGQATAAPPGGSADAPGGPARQKGGATDGPPLKATDTEIFFAKDSTELTASDTAALDAYATAMTATTDAISVTGYSSVDGDPTHNAKLATERANAVKKYLTDKGIDAKRITAEGHGVTGQFGEKDLPSNRRVMLAPKPPAKAAAPPADEYDALPADAPVDPKKIDLNLTGLDPARVQNIIGEDKGASREQVVKELTRFFEDLMKSQGGKSLRLDGTARYAARAIGKGLPNEMGIEAKATGTINRMPKELAEDIGKLLPDFIPRENFDNFNKMQPKEIKGQEKFSVASAITKLVTPVVKDLTGWLPEPIRKKIEDSIEDAVVKGLVGIADKAMEGSGLDDKAKKAIHSAVEAAIKEKGEKQGP